MPDIQGYTLGFRQPFGGAHLDLVTRYICDHRTRWVEPRTGKSMPIVMVIQLGDLVSRADHIRKGETPYPEWAVVDAAFDNLDACEPRVPYLVTNGNHDVEKRGVYHELSRGYNHYFGVERWANLGSTCADPDDCDWNAGEWFIGGGDPIEKNSRNNVGPGEPGPRMRQPGRHRAGVIRVPGGQRLLFMGLEQAFDFPPPARGFESIEGDDAKWPHGVLGAYATVPSILFHHSMFWTYGPNDTRVRFGPETWGSDSLSPARDSPVDQGGMRDIWDLLVAPYPQVFMVFSGHVIQPATQADFTIERGSSPPVSGLLRNYQNVGLPGEEDPQRRYGVGWNVIAAFDPDAGEVRVRSYRIDDVESYADPGANKRHVGAPAATECLDMDHAGVGERVVPWSFPVGSR